MHPRVIDIMDYKKMDGVLSQPEGIYQAIFENTGTAMVILDENATVSLVVDCHNNWTEIV